MRRPSFFEEMVTENDSPETGLCQTVVDLPAQTVAEDQFILIQPNRKARFPQ